MDLDDYIAAHSEPEPPYLRRLRRRVNLELVYPRMCSGHLQGRLLKMLVQLTGARRVLEIGTYAGYSALCLAEGLPGEDPSARVDTLEIDAEMEPFIRRALADAPPQLASLIHLRIADALAPGVLPVVDACHGVDAPGPRRATQNSCRPLPYDLVYMDSNKRTYTELYERLLPLLRPGGLLVADNTLWGGKVCSEGPAARDAQTMGILRFNDHVARDPRVTPVMLPLRDGLTLLRRLP